MEELTNVERLKARRKRVKLLMFMGTALLITIILFSMMMNTIHKIQGAGRVINYTGMVRGASQRLIKKEFTGIRGDADIARLDEIMGGLKHGESTYKITPIMNEYYREKLEVLASGWEDLKRNILIYRENPMTEPLLYEKSELFFTHADQAVDAAESYSENLASRLLAYDLSLEPPQDPKIYELNQSVWIEDQEILLEELTQYPTMSLFTYSIKNSNTMDISMSMDFYNDGVLTPLNTTGYLTQHEDSPDGKTTITMRIQDNYFKVPEERLLKIHSYTMVPKDRKPLKVNLEEKTLEENPYGILLNDITTEDRVTTITFHTSENYHSLPFKSARDEKDSIKQALYTSYTEDLNNKTYSYSFQDVIGDALYFDVADGPLKTLREPILIPIPMAENR